MAYKYFLDLDPEDDMIDSSLLTKFRKTRITEDILEEMLKETITQAIQKRVDKINGYHCRLYPYQCCRKASLTHTSITKFK